MRRNGISELSFAFASLTTLTSYRRGGIVRPRSVMISRPYSSPMSNAFWAELNLAVKHGRGEQAEELVTGLLKNDQSSKLDPKIFSLALEAWNNSKSPLAAGRSQKLLDHMFVLAKEGVLRDYPSLDDYHAVLECWAASGDTTLHAAESALRIVQLIIQHYSPTDYTFLCVLQVLANGGHASNAMDFLETMIPKPHTIDVYNLILQAYSRSNNPDAAEHAQALLENMQNAETDLPQPNATSYHMVLQSWANNSAHPEASKHAEQLLTQMKAQKLQTTLACYQTVISLLAQKGEASRAERLLTSLVTDYGVQFDAQLKPTPKPFETVLLAYTKFFHADAAPRAESLLTHMKELFHTGILDYPPDVWCYNYVLKCWMHSRRDDATTRALQFLETMREDGVIPDIATMNTVLNTIAKQQNARQAEKFLNQLYQAYLDDPSHNPQPNVVSFGTVLKAWSLSKDPEATERAEALLLKLQNLHESGLSQCRPDQAIFSSVIKCYASSHTRDAPYKAEAVLREMQQTAQREKNPDLNPDTVCWNMTINAWAQAGNGPRAEELFKEMLDDYLRNKSTGAAPNNVTFTAVLSAWAKTQNNARAAECAENLLQQMKHLARSNSIPNVKPNVISYSIVLDCLAYAKSTTSAIRAEGILREMQASDDPSVQPNVISFNSVIKAWSLSGDPRALIKVTSLLKEMICGLEDHGKKQMTPNENTFGSVLKVLAESRAPDKDKRALIVVGLMEKFGVNWNDWSRRQLRRCTENVQGRQRKVKKADELPAIPDLKYS